MDIMQSKFGKKHPKEAGELKPLISEGRSLGATEGMQRLELICDQYNQLSPNNAYMWIDPGSIQLEIEEARLHKGGLEFTYILRNILSLAPLIATWIALFFAVGNYQKYILAHTNDRTPFLQLWQSGFNGATWFTFTVAAGIDVIFLSAYLLSILLVHEMERRARARAVAYSTNLQNGIDKLLECVANDGIMHVGDKADIDKVVDGVKQVIDASVISVKQIMDDAADTVKQFVQQTGDANTQALNNFEQSFKTHLSDTQTSVKLVVDASTQAITDSNQKVETLYTTQVVPLMTDFHTDMKTLHTELGNYQGRLNDLTKASQELATASQKLTLASEELVKNAGLYTSIGSEISTQIGSLNRTQQEVLLQIHSVASGITTAAGNMTTATGSMEQATINFGNVARQIDIQMQRTIPMMTTSVSQAAQALYNITPRLDQTAAALYQAAVLLTSIRRGLGPFPWRFRRTNRTQQTGPNQTGYTGSGPIGQPPQPPQPGYTGNSQTGQPPQPPQPGYTSSSQMRQPPQPGYTGSSRMGQPPQSGNSRGGQGGQPPQRGTGTTN